MRAAAVKPRDYVEPASASVDPVVLAKDTAALKDFVNQKKLASADPKYHKHLTVRAAEKKQQLATVIQSVDDQPVGNVQFNRRTESFKQRVATFRAKRL